MHPVEALFLPLGWVLRNHRPDVAESLANRPELATSGRMQLTSPAFLDGETIPARYCGPLIGQNISPALLWDGLPAHTHELLLIIEDLDSPGKAPGIHTIALLVNTGKGLAEGELNTNNDGVRFVPDHRGRGRYVGPRPLPGHGTHRYRFHLYALDLTVKPAAAVSTEQLLAAVNGHVLAAGVITGTRRS